MGISRSGRATLSSNSREIGCKSRITKIMYMVFTPLFIKDVFVGKRKLAHLTKLTIVIVVFLLQLVLSLSEKYDKCFKCLCNKIMINLSPRTKMCLCCEEINI